MEHESLGLAQLIQSVRSELAESHEQLVKSGKPDMFQVKDFDLEINFVAKANSQVKGGFEYQVLTAESSVERSAEKAQKIKLHLVAVEQKKEIKPGKIINIDQGASPEDDKRPANPMLHAAHK